MHIYCKAIKILQLYWNHTSAWVFSCKFAAYFQNTFSQEYLRVSLSEYYLWKVFHLWTRKAFPTEHVSHVDLVSKYCSRGWRSFVLVSYTQWLNFLLFLKNIFQSFLITFVATIKSFSEGNIEISVINKWWYTFQEITLDLKLRK